MTKLAPKVDRLTYSVAEVAYMLTTSKETVYELIRQQKIPSVLLGEKRVVIPIKPFNEWFKDKIVLPTEKR